MTKQSAYEKPTIIKIGNPIYTKHGVSSSASFPTRSDIEGQSIESLCQKYGSPLFVFSETTLRNQFRKYQSAFRSRYPDVKLSWSYKTNYLKAICSVLHQEGALAEVVSDFEYDKARALGIRGEDIIYNGPYKTRESLVRAAKEGAKIHIDHIDEIATLESIAQELHIPIQVGLRINLNTGIFPLWTRFGLNLESDQAIQAVERIVKGRTLRIAGLHTHIGTFVLDPAAYHKAARSLCEFLLKIEDKFAVKIDYIDMGGGFPSKNHLKGIYQPPEIAVPPIDDYAEQITSAIKETLSGRKLPQLLLESGRHVIDEAGFLITSVVAQKLLPDGRRAYVLDAGVNLLYTSTWYKYKIEMDGAENTLAEPSILYGPLCMNIDVVDEGLLLPRLPLGKRLILSPVGAYNVTQWMQFIQYRPAVALIRTSGSVELIRARESLQSVELNEQLPEDLKIHYEKEIAA